MAKATEKITDFGDTVAGSKKSLWRTRGFLKEDILEMGDKEILTSVKKQVIWSVPDYNGLYAEGCYREDLYYLKICYTALGATIPVYLAHSVKEAAADYTDFLLGLKGYLLAQIRQHTLNYNESVLQYLQDNGYLEKNLNSVYNRYTWKLTSKANNNPAFSKLFVGFLDNCIRKRYIPRELISELLAKAQGSLENEGVIEARIALLDKERNYKAYGDNIIWECYLTGFPNNYQATFQNFKYYKNLSNTACSFDFILKYKSVRYQKKYPMEKTDIVPILRLIANETVTNDFIALINAKKEEQAAEVKSEKKDLKNVTRIELPYQYVIRKGPVLRKGDAKIESLLYVEGNQANRACFDFRGGEFGNWQNKRQECLNCAVDAFSDLAYITDLPFDAMSLCLTGLRNHRLTIAWGSRGSGNARAHYEPATTVINLTKFKGAGTLAHEWAHALDHALGRWYATLDMDISSKDAHAGYLTSLNDWRRDQHTEEEKKLYALMNDVMDTIRRVTKHLTQEEIETERTKTKASYEKNLRLSLTANITNVLYKVESGKREELRQYLTEQLERLLRGEISFEEYKGVFIEKKLKNKFKSTEEIRYTGEINCIVHPEQIKVRDEIVVSTKYYTDARAFDRERTTAYYTLATELFARAFESYIEDSLKEHGMQSEYLVYGTNSPVYKLMYDGHNPYPEGEERQRINEKIRVLLQYVGDVVVGRHLDDRYKVIYRRNECQEAKYFDETKKEDISETAKKKENVAQENLAYTESVINYGGNRGIIADNYVKDKEMLEEAKKELQVISELPQYERQIICSIKKYTKDTGIVEIQACGDENVLQMQVKYVSMLYSAGVLKILEGKEKIPALETVPVMRNSI